MLFINIVIIETMNSLWMINFLPFFLLYLPLATFTLTIASSLFVDVPSALSLVLGFVMNPVYTYHNSIRIEHSIDMCGNILQNIYMYMKKL